MLNSSNLVNKIFYFFCYLFVVGGVIFFLATGAAFIVRSANGLGIILFPILFFLLPLLLSFFISVIVFIDAHRFKIRGAQVGVPFFWALGSFFIIGLPIYLSFRIVDFRKQVEDKPRVHEILTKKIQLDHLDTAPSL